MTSLSTRIGTLFKELGNFVIKVDMRQESRVGKCIHKWNKTVFRRPQVVVVKLEKMPALPLRIRRKFPKLKILVIGDDSIHKSKIKTPVFRCSQTAIRWLCLGIAMLISIIAYKKNLLSQYNRTLVYARKYDKQLIYVQRGKLDGDLEFKDEPNGPTLWYKTNLHGNTTYQVNLSKYKEYPIHREKVTYNKRDNMTVIKIGFLKDQK